MEWIVMLIKALAGTAGGLLALWGGYPRGAGETPPGPVEPGAV